MADREKVKKGLDLCLTGEPSTCKDCPYDAECKEARGIGPSPLRRDALELLKGQEPVKPVVNVDEWVCGCCGTRLERQELISPNAIFHDFFEYCPHCGKKVDWKEVKQDG